MFIVSYSLFLVYGYTDNRSFKWTCTQPIKGTRGTKFIRIQGEEKESPSNTENLITKYKGAMTTQSIAEIDKQLYDLRKEWIYKPIQHPPRMDVIEPPC